MNKIRLAANQENIEKIVDGISIFAEQNGFSLDVRRKINISIEETLVNIINYAYPECDGEMEISYRKENDTKLIVEILDNGIPFDPLSIPKPALTATLSDRKVGGLGVLFIRKLTEDVRYRRDGNANILTLIYTK